MENTIELTDVVRKPNTFLIILKDAYRATKFLVCASALIGTVEAAKYGWKLGEQRLWLEHDKYIAQYIETDLANKTFEFNEKGGSKQLSAMSRAEILKALWVMNEQYETQKQVVEHLKNVLSYE